MLAGQTSSTVQSCSPPFKTTTMSVLLSHPSKSIATVCARLTSVCAHYMIPQGKTFYLNAGDLTFAAFITMLNTTETTAFECTCKFYLQRLIACLYFFLKKGSKHWLQLFKCEQQIEDLLLNHPWLKHKHITWVAVCNFADVSTPFTLAAFIMTSCASSHLKKNKNQTVINLIATFIENRNSSNPMRNFLFYKES